MPNSLTYGGRPFRVPPEPIRTLAERYQAVGRLPDVTAPRPSPARNLLGLSLPDRPSDEPGWNELLYPTGATRFAWFRGLMTGTDLAAVMGDAYGSGTLAALPFVATANGVTVETDLFMLPPRPLAILSADLPAGLDSLHAVTLVDERYYWQDSGAGDIDCTAATGTGTWAGLLDYLSGVLGVTLTYSALEAEYGVPEPDSPLYSHEESPAALLDAAAANLGRFVARNLDGTYELVRWSEAAAAALDAGLGDTDQDRAAGALVLPFDPGQDAPARAAVVPSEVVVTFPKWVDGSGYARPGPNYRAWRPWAKSYHEVYRVSVTPAGLGGPYASLPVSGQSVALHTTAKARFASSGASSPSNAAALEALAGRLAKDLIDRSISGADVAYPGVFAADPRWGHDVAWAWQLRADGARTHTRVARPAWGRTPREFQHALDLLADPTRYLTNVCATSTSGFITSITVESEGSDGVRECDTNPTGCCPLPPITTCTALCPSIPRRLYAKYVSGCDLFVADCLNGGATPGALPLDWDGSGWEGINDGERPITPDNPWSCTLGFRLFCGGSGYVEFAGGSGSTTWLYENVEVLSCSPFCARITIPDTGGFTGPCRNGGVFLVSDDPTFANCPPKDGYDCVGGACVAAAGGTYPTLTACQAACGVPQSFNCAAGRCTDPGDGTGTYPTLADCEASCAVSPSWNCTGGACVDPGDGTGTYSTLAACEVACGVLESYNCVNLSCVDPGDGSGNFTGPTALSDCQAACEGHYGCDAYFLPGGTSFTRTGTDSWAGGSQTLTTDEAGNWLLTQTSTGGQWGVTGWDGVGCATFVPVTPPASTNLTICCTDGPIGCDSYTIPDGTLTRTGNTSWHLASGVSGDTWDLTLNTPTGFTWELKDQSTGHTWRAAPGNWTGSGSKVFNPFSNPGDPNITVTCG